MKKNKKGSIFYETLCMITNSIEGWGSDRLGIIL